MADSNGPCELLDVAVGVRIRISGESQFLCGAISKDAHDVSCICERNEKILVVFDFR